MLEARVHGCVGTLTIEAAFDTLKGPLVLVGPNGAGKTSLLLMLLGALRPDAGRIAIGEQVIFDSERGLELPLELRRIGYLPQDYGLFPHLDVRQNIEFALRSHAPRLRRAVLRARADAMLDRLELRALATRSSRTLSGGEQQRVALARALSVEPRALLLDEPLSALDLGTRKHVRAFLASYLQELALPTVIVTHDPLDALALAARIAVLDAGRLVQLGTFAELAACPATPFVAEFVASATAASG